MKKAKKLISLLLALTMLLSMIPMAVAAETTVNLGRTKLDDAILEKGTPSSFSHLRDMKDGSAAKGVGETGFWQRLPRNTVVGYGTVTPVNYAVPKEGSVTVSNEGVIGDFSFSLEPWAGNEFTTNPPCLQFNYTALAVGSTTVTVKYYYNYGLINIQGGRTWYEETATFTINVNDLLISSCINEYLSNIPSMLFLIIFKVTIHAGLHERSKSISVLLVNTGSFILT